MLGAHIRCICSESAVVKGLVSGIEVFLGPGHHRRVMESTSRILDPENCPTELHPGRSAQYDDIGPGRIPGIGHPRPGSIRGASPILVGWPPKGTRPRLRHRIPGGIRGHAPNQRRPAQRRNTRRHVSLQHTRPIRRPDREVRGGRRSQRLPEQRRSATPFMSWCRTRRSLLAVDLEKVDYLSSSGVAILVGLKRRVDTHNGKIVFFQCPARRARPPRRHEARPLLHHRRRRGPRPRRPPSRPHGLIGSSAFLEPPDSPVSPSP